MAELDNLSRKIDDQIASVNRSKTITIVVYLALCVLIFGYTTWMGGKVKEATDAKGLADFASNKVIEQIPAARKEIAGKVKEMAPKMVDDAINEIRAQIPQLRAKAKEYVIAQIEKPLMELDQELWGHVDIALADHGDEVRMMIMDLKDEDRLHMVEDSLYEILTTPLQEPQIQLDLESYAHTLQSIESRLKMLVEGTNLTPEQRIERDLLIAVSEISRRSPAYQERESITKDMK